MTDYLQILNELKGKRFVLIEQRDELEKSKVDLERQVTNLTEARDVVNAVQLATQVTIKDFIEEIVTLALKSVFGDEYAFKIDYEIKRGKSECQLYVVKNGEIHSPEDEVGGGVIDVCSLALRASLFAIANTKPEPVFILDEPGKFVSRGERIEKFGRMIKELSNLLGIQVIYVTHDPALVENADRVFRVSQSNGISNVVQA